ncbi:MAG TPA: hypothetical protein VGS57_02925 [Thermoanaerobaculia bacterium]|nr:hypothetical protein [Thermoanaerobaculia bacterium]
MLHPARLLRAVPVIFLLAAGGPAGAASAARIAGGPIANFTGTKTGHPTR